MLLDHRWQELALHFLKSSFFLFFPPANHVVASVDGRCTVRCERGKEMKRLTILDWLRT